MGLCVSQRAEEAKRSLLRTPTKVCLIRLASNLFLGVRIYNVESLLGNEVSVSSSSSSSFQHNDWLLRAISDSDPHVLFSNHVVAIESIFSVVFNHDSFTLYNRMYTLVYIQVSHEEG
jgi:hypothetical protein